MLVSIAMATYNGESYLQQQLDSFTSQTRLPDELIVCDDRSTDLTIDILQKYKSSAPFQVKIIKNDENLGYVKNFEKSLSMCNGDIIFLSDQDDVWLSRKIETFLHQFTKRSEKNLIACDMLLTDAHLNPTDRSLLDNSRLIRSDLKTFAYGCGTAITKNFLQILMPFPSDIFSHDGWMHAVAIELQTRGIEEAPLQYYRRHGLAASNTLASRDHIPSTLSMLIENRLMPSTVGWLEAIHRIEVILERLETRSEEIDQLGLSCNAKKSQKTLLQEIYHLRKRIQICSRSRRSRIIPVGKLYFDGGYVNFSGWKSGLKDLIRP